MKRRYSLKKNSEFQYVYRVGKRYGGRLMTLVALKSRSGVRVGFSVSKKVGKAVVRNRVKRVMRECVRPLIGSLRPCRLVFIARDTLVGEPYAQVERAVRSLIGKADVLSQRRPAQKDMMN